jgi:hypothetical protein
MEKKKMKIRKGFVSNSSSTAFIITNLTDEEKTLVDFVTETPWLIEKYMEGYSVKENDGFSQGLLMVSAEENNLVFKPHEERLCSFGDEDGTLIGAVYDYMLRGDDISECARLLDQVNNEEDPEKAAMLGRLWMAAMGDSEKEDEFTGVDSPSFKVRFHSWLR